MKFRFLASAAVVGVLGLPAFSYAEANADEARPVTYVKDSVITAKIKAKLAAENFASTTDLKVETDNAGAVYLTGVAASDAEAKRAVDIVRQTEGVKSVNSEIKVARQS